jgi:hypothetical protein
MSRPDRGGVPALLVGLTAAFGAGLAGSPAARAVAVAAALAVLAAPWWHPAATFAGCLIVATVAVGELGTPHRFGPPPSPSPRPCSPCTWCSWTPHPASAAAPWCPPAPRPWPSPPSPSPPTYPPDHGPRWSAWQRPRPRWSQRWARCAAGPGPGPGPEELLFVGPAGDQRGDPDVPGAGARAKIG